VWHDLQPTIEIALKFLITAATAIIVLWLIARLLGDTIGEFFSGLIKELKEFSVLDPKPTSLNLIGGVAMFGTLLFFSRRLELALFSPLALTGEVSWPEIGMAIGGAVIIGAYFLACIRANRT